MNDIDVRSVVYIYDPSGGDPKSGIAPGTAFLRICRKIGSVQSRREEGSEFQPVLPGESSWLCRKAMRSKP